jgi:hypothetical protein
MGAWLFIFDRLTGFGEKMGFAYYYLLDKMFSVELDATYNKVILSYGIFILLFQGFSYIGIHFLKRKFSASPDSDSKNIITLTPTPFLLISMTCLICSFWLIKDVFASSLILHESVYSNVRSGFIPHYSIHQYFNWVMVFSFAFYVGIYYRVNLNHKGAIVKKPNWIFWTCFVLMVTYLSVIGSRHEMFLGGLFLILFISYPFQSIRKNKRLYLTFFVGFFCILAINDPMRGMTSVLSDKLGFTSLVNTKGNREMADVYSKDRTFFLHRDMDRSMELIEASKMQDTIFVLKGDTIVMKQYEFVEQTKKHPDRILFEGKYYKINNRYVSFGYKKMNAGEKLVKAVTNIVFSNELFAGHFSLYGIYSHDVKPSYGIALRYLVKKEKQSTYDYYANQLNLPDNQGFTINHISSWYINFGYTGFVLGALFLAVCYLVPLYFYNWLTQVKKKNGLFILTVLVGMTAYMPLIIRSDLLVFEGLFKQVVIVPGVILLLVKLYNYLFQSKKRSHVE